MAINQIEEVITFVIQHYHINSIAFIIFIGQISLIVIKEVITYYFNFIHIIIHLFDHFT